MDSTFSLIHFTVPYVMICGSYQRNRINDKLCNLLGTELAKFNIGVISAGGKPALKISESMNKMLSDLGQYDPNKIVTVYRKKGKTDELKIKRIGSILFVGNDIHDIRDYIFSKSKVLIAIGGATKTKEEVLIAQERKIPVIPVGISGGTGLDIWLQYKRLGKHENETLFAKLNNENVMIVSDAIIDILKKLISDD